jgi:putative transposase
MNAVWSPIFQTGFCYGVENDGSAGLQPGRKSAQVALERDVRGWYSRGYLAHRDETGLVQSITFRLADALPVEKLRQYHEQLVLRPARSCDVECYERIERWLDAGMGCCALRHGRMARTMEDALLRFDGERYHLFAWCIMPNHVHVLIKPEAPLAQVVQSWKAFSGRWALAHNAELELGVPGRGFWMREYWDRYIRNEEHLRQTIDYIHLNPVKAGLCDCPTVWPWSSARYARGRRA